MKAIVMLELKFDTDSMFENNDEEREKFNAMSKEQQKAHMRSMFMEGQEDFLEANPGGSAKITFLEIEDKEEVIRM